MKREVWVVECKRYGNKWMILDVRPLKEDAEESLREWGMNHIISKLPRRVTRYIPAERKKL